MPFQSEAQRRFMYAKHPAIAKRWSDEYGTPDDLPEHKRKGKKKKKGKHDKALEGLKRARD